MYIYRTCFACFFLSFFCLIFDHPYFSPYLVVQDRYDFSIILLNNLKFFQFSKKKVARMENKLAIAPKYGKTIGCTAAKVHFFYPTHDLTICTYRGQTSVTKGFFFHPRRVGIRSISLCQTFS